MIEPNSTNIVTQANRLVEARYKLSVNEQKIVLAVISMIEPEDRELRNFKMKVSDLVGLLGLNNKRFYDDLKKNLTNIKDTTLTIDKGNNEGYLLTSWFSSIDYIQKRGEVEFRIDEKLMPYLIQVKREFVSANLDKLISFKGYNAIRIYALIKQCENRRIKSREFKVEEIKEILGLNKKSYPVFNDFRRYVILPAQKELDKKDKHGNYISDIGFCYETIKTGRKITAIKFIIKKHEIVRAASQKREDIESINYLVAYGVSQRKSEELAGKHTEEEILKCISLYEDKRKRGKADSVGLLIKLIEEGAGKKTAEEIKQEEKQKQTKEQRSQEQIQELREKFGREYSAIAKTDFINSLNPDEKELLLDEILENHKGSSIVFDIIKKAGLKCQLIGAEVLAKIPNYKKNKEKYISEQLKKVI